MGVTKQQLFEKIKRLLGRELTRDEQKFLILANQTLEKDPASKPKKSKSKAS